MLSPKRGEAGASAVEFALILPLLVVLIFGIIFGGFAFNTKLTITQAAREGARFGATLPLEPGQSVPGDAWFAAVLERVEDSAFGDQGLRGGERYVCIRFVPDSGTAVPPREFGNTAAGDCTLPSSSVDDRERVEVVVSRPTTLEFIFYSFDVTLRSAGIARYEAPLQSGGGS